MIKVETKGISYSDQKYIDKIVDLETERKVNKVKDSKSYIIRTACFIDGEFVLISDYSVPEDITKKLEEA